MTSNDWLLSVPGSVLARAWVNKGYTVSLPSYTKDGTEVSYGLTPKQLRLWKLIRDNDGMTNTFAYGGAFGGGKTYAALAIVVTMALLYPGSHWTVVRETRQRCKETSWLALKKFYRFLFKKLNESELIAHLHNGSRIVMKGENIHSDPDLDAWKSFDTNGIMIEQGEEVTEEMYEMAVLRAGRWRIDPQPPSFVLITFNPADNWIKDRFYIPYVENRLQPGCVYISATIKDNPFLYNDPAYMAKFKTMDERTRKRYMDGDWDAITPSDAWAYSYNENVHLSDPGMEPYKGVPLLISFDFNVQPFSVTVQQSGEDFHHTYDEIAVYEPHKDLIKLMCTEIKRRYPGFLYIVTGDASGRQRELQSKRNAYEAIQTYMNLDDEQMEAPRRNLGLVDSRILCNSALANFPIKIHPRCARLRRELKNAKPSGTKIVKDRAKNKNDFLDTWRYGIHYSMPFFLEWMGEED